MAKKAEITTELEQLSQSSVYEKKFTISTAWCFAINNIDYIRISIAPLAKDLGLENIVEALREHRTHEEADRCRQTLQLIIDNAADTVKNKIIELLEVVANKMSPAMNRYERIRCKTMARTLNKIYFLRNSIFSNLANSLV